MTAAPTHSVAKDPCPEALPVIYIHHGPQGDMVYADRPVLIVHVDDGQPLDRVFVRASFMPPADLIHGPVGCTQHGCPETVPRKQRMVAWLERVGAKLAPLLSSGTIQ
ncbi:hypothetical protein [Paracoccus sp. IB05]|uniref:hypothetical protein n=1 Tax=Paracoccus sp. IB05 TaxID=2779367 RepID=UPI0018E6F03F|nr:hypothetical protein [Paracoccus sp. IB05]MBJ2150653.1 hypothetical protein [Paracoccus sp. IB05]